MRRRQSIAAVMAVALALVAAAAGAGSTAPTDRSVKLDLIGKLKQGPGILILGDSRGRQAEPSLLQRLTGHTGFKGGWLSLWLRELGAEVAGFSLPAPTEPSFFEQTRLAELVTHVEGDVRELAAVEAAVRAARPEVVFHLAAQPLVRLSTSSRSRPMRPT